MTRADRENNELDFQIEFYEGILKRDPNLVDVLITLGDAYTRRGYHEKGLEIDLRLSRLKSRDPVVFYNLACSYSLLGKIDSALEALEKAFVLGYSELDYLESDPDLENLHKEPRLSQLVQKYFKGRAETPSE
jgi:tetratricopeptide (TPR) repeat protein